MSQPDVCANCERAYNLHNHKTRKCMGLDTKWFPKRLADAMTHAGFSTLPVQGMNADMYECRDCWSMVRSGSETKHAEVCGKRRA